jgi:uncharacterized protein (TIGR02246 family)
MLGHPLDHLYQKLDRLESCADSNGGRGSGFVYRRALSCNSPFDFIRPKASSPTTLTILPHEPEDWPRLFEQHFNAGDLDAVMALYDAEARFVTRSGETLVGRDAIREVLAGMIAAKTQFRSHVVRAVTVDDIAQLYTDFEGTTVDSSGNTVSVHSKAIEVLRRQPDSGWKLIMGDPNGRR